MRKNITWKKGKREILSSINSIKVVRKNIKLVRGEGNENVGVENTNLKIMRNDEEYQNVGNFILYILYTLYLWIPEMCLGMELIIS